MDKKTFIMEKFDENYQLYIEFLDYFYNTIKGILKSEDIILQSIDKRIKNRESLEKKITSKDKYEKLEDITDVCGMRIITYFSDDVDKIAEFISEEFKVDEINSVDKRKNDDPTKFGYVSLHYIVSLKENRTALSEASRFKGLKLEIQIRTILQHAWAEIEHDLGYKNITDIPDTIRRSFSRLAGIIEIADEEFIRIKKMTNSYSEEVKLKIENQKSEKVAIDIVSILAFVNTDKQYRSSLYKLDSFMPKPTRPRVTPETNKKLASYLIEYCNKLNVNTIDEMKKIYFKYFEGVSRIYREEIKRGLEAILDITPLINIFAALSLAENTSLDVEDFNHYYYKNKKKNN